MLSERLRWTTTLLQDAAFETLEVRLVRQVLYLARVDSQRTDAGLRLGGRFRQGDLADLLGTTTRSIITILNGWRAAGLVSFDGAAAQLVILKPDALKALIEHSEA
jgi:CRP-like cAMP-binding protein